MAQTITFTVTRQGAWWRLAVLSRLYDTDAGEWIPYQRLTTAELTSVVESHLGRAFGEQISLF